MRKYVWQLLLPIAALCSLPALGMAQGPKVEASSRELASVRGTVTDSLGRPVADATVELSSTGQFSLIRVRTSALGEFFTDSLIAGDTYTVAAMRLGYRASESKPFRANAETPHTVNIVLKARPTVMLQADNKPRKAKTDSVQFRAQAQ